MLRRPVAVLSILLAIIKLPVRERGFWEDGIRHQERGYTRVSGRRRQGCNQRVVERLGFDRASSQGADADWRSSQMASLSSAARSLFDATRVDGAALAVADGKNAFFLSL